VTRAYLDTNFLFGLFRDAEGVRAADPLFGRWRRRVEVALAADRPLISALVIDELTYRLVLSWLIDSGTKDALGAFRNDTPLVMRRMGPKLEALWRSIARLDPELAPSDEEDVVLAQTLMIAPGIAPRDAFHAAYALRGGCRWIVSSDETFDRLDSVERLGPEEPG
jgi:predicted nucleic acid-binding protein